jgi:aconitate hydratase
MSSAASRDTFHTLTRLTTKTGTYRYFSLPALATQCDLFLERLPVSIRILLESLLRNENGRNVTDRHVRALACYDPRNPPDMEIPFLPARILLQDYTGVPALVDLASLRSALARLGGDPQRINPSIPVDLVVDHSVQVDFFGSPSAREQNTDLELQRNHERYEFLRWGQQTLQNFSVIPPGSGICHQVNLEHLGQVVQKRDGLIFPDTLVGTDSHTPMINGLGILGWGVGGIEAEAVMLGQPLFLLAPHVVGVRLTGALAPGVLATDLVLTVTECLRRTGVVGKFVEFFGTGLSHLTVPDRATLANMAPEYGATIGFFPVDRQTLDYLELTGRPDSLVELVRDYSKAQGLWRTDNTPDPSFEQIVEIDLSTVETSLAGPKRPQDRVALSHMKDAWQESLSIPPQARGFGLDLTTRQKTTDIELGEAGRHTLRHGAVALAAITSCTNTSNPSVMLAAGLLAKKAVKRGLRTQPWVKTSLAPGSLTVTEYLDSAGLLPALEQLGFHVVGYGCTTCIGNSGPLLPAVTHAVEQEHLIVAAVLSGNRNFEGRINPQVKASFLTSPPLVVAYALAGHIDIDFTQAPLGTDTHGKPVWLKDLWPTQHEIQSLLRETLKPKRFQHIYQNIEQSNSDWNKLTPMASALYPWSPDSTYIQEPPFFTDMTPDVDPIGPFQNARVLVLLGDSVTTDHISPAGAIPPDSPAAHYLQAQGVAPQNFNSYGSRRGNDRVMTRGTFGNIRLKNHLAPDTEGGWTRLEPNGEIISIYEAAQAYQSQGIPTLVIAGRDYGMGSSRDWAAKGTALLGVRAVLAQSYERIHRSNLVGMGVLPLQFLEGQNADTMELTGWETFNIPVNDNIEPRQRLTVSLHNARGEIKSFDVTARLDSAIEIQYYRNGGILQTVLRSLL